MSATSVILCDRDVIWGDAEFLPELHSRIFDVDWLESQGMVHGSARGRGQSFFLNINGKELVLRRFVRGGLIGKVISDRYLRLGADRSRAFLEYHLLGWMRDRNLPVPRPVAARYSPNGLYYRADLITARIPDAYPLADAIRTVPLPEGVWHTIGRVVRQMHMLGVDHVDLNSRNILLDDAGQIWLIDFDRCRRRSGSFWMQGNLDRLRRSLVKESRAQPVFYWSDEEWMDLMAGYSSRGVGL